MKYISLSLLVILLSSLTFISPFEPPLRLEGPKLTAAKIEKALKKNKAVRDLFISSATLDSFPDALFEVTWAKHLLISHVTLKDGKNYDDKFCKMNNLQQLTVNSSDLGDFNYPNGCLLYVRSVSLTNCPAPNFTLRHGNMSIRNLSLHKCQLTKLPDNISTYKRLEQVSFGDNPIVDYNNEISKLRGLKHLKVLGLAYSNLPAIPDAVYELDSLQKLYFHGNDLTSVDPRLKRLTALKEIKIFQNKTPFTPEFKAKLEEVLPEGCKIYYTMTGR